MKKPLTHSEKEEKRRREVEKKLYQCLDLISQLLQKNYQCSQLPVRFEPDGNIKREDLKMTDLVRLNPQFQTGISNGTLPPNHEMINPEKILNIISELQKLIYCEPYDE